MRISSLYAYGNILSSGGLEKLNHFQDSISSNLLLSNFVSYITHRLAQFTTDTILHLITVIKCNVIINNWQYRILNK
jgi:hypothetical protein